MKPDWPRRQLPPTAGLPLRWRDLLCGSHDFSARLAEQLAIPLPLLTCSGTAALIVALRTLQQRHPERHEVIVAAFTCPLVALAARFCPPLRVVPCDLQAESIDLDLHQLRRLCSHRTLAVIVTHLAGRVADADAAVQIARPLGAAVIEDAAQALGARNRGKSVGLTGDIGFFSLAFGKGLTTAEGGVLFSRSPELGAALEATKRQILPPRPGMELRRCMELWGYRWFYRPSRLDWVYGRPQRQALARQDLMKAVGDDVNVDDIPLHRLGAYRQRVAAAALLRLPGWLQQNRLRAAGRIAQLQQLPQLVILQDSQQQRGVWPFILLLLPSVQARDRAMDALWLAGLGVTRLFITTLQHYPAVSPLLKAAESTPNATDFAARSLTISNTHWLTDADFELILHALRRALR